LSTLAHTHFPGALIRPLGHLSLTGANCNLISGPYGPREGGIVTNRFRRLVILRTHMRCMFASAAVRPVEPSVRALSTLAHTHFPSALLRPLGHLSLNGADCNLISGPYGPREGGIVVNRFRRFPILRTHMRCMFASAAVRPVEPSVRALSTLAHTHFPGALLRPLGNPSLNGADCNLISDPYGPREGGIVVNRFRRFPILRTHMRCMFASAAVRPVEPSVRALSTLAHTHFPGALLRPLGHLSKRRAL